MYTYDAIGSYERVGYGERWHGLQPAAVVLLIQGLCWGLWWAEESVHHCAATFNSPTSAAFLPVLLPHRSCPIRPLQWRCADPADCAQLLDQYAIPAGLLA